MTSYSIQTIPTHLLMKQKNTLARLYVEVQKKLSEYVLLLGNVNEEVLLEAKLKFIQKGALALPIEFGWLHDLRGQHNIAHYHIGRCTGYDESRIEGEKNFAILHPAFQTYYAAFMLALYDSLTNIRFKPGVSIYSICIPMVTQHKSIIYIQRTKTPVLTDDMGRVVLFAVHNQVLGKYHGEAPHWNIFGQDSVTGERLTTAITEKLQACCPTPFTKRQEVILSFIHKNLDQPLSALAEPLNLKPTSFKTHSRDILERAREAYPLEAGFKDVGDVAGYWGRMGMIK